MPAIVLSLFVLGFGTSAAFAGYASSDSGYFTVGGHQYVNSAYVSTSTSSHWALSGTHTNWTSGSIPAGYAGSRGRVFECSSGTLKAQSNIVYNSAGSEALANSPLWYTTAGNSAYGYGVSWGWNGSGYSASYTFSTSCQNT